MTNTTLSWEQRRLLIVLGLPSLGTTLSYTLVTTYLPVFIERLSGAGVIGLMIGCEGLFAFIVPFVIGGWSDSFQSKLGRRLPFIFTGTLLICISLILMPISSNYLSLLVIELGIFFIGFFTNYAAYYAFFPDLIPKEQYGRSQGILGSFRSFGMLLSLVGGGIMLHFWEPLPFLIATFILIIVNIILYYGILDKIKKQSTNRNKNFQIQWKAEWKLVSDNRQIRLWFIANSFWEAAIAALKVFIVLYFTRGLEFTLRETSGALALVGIAALIAAPIAGKMADQYTHKPVILASIACFAVGLTPPLFTMNTHYIVGILPVAFAAVILMTLPYSLLMKHLPKEKYHGAGAALFALSQGIGAIIGPITAGIAIEIFKNVNFLYFEKTHGYVVIFLISSIFLFLSIPFAFLLFKIKLK